MEVISASDDMRRAVREAQLGVRFGVARVLVSGEPGVGRQHLARFMHHLRAPDEPFVVVQCDDHDVEMGTAIWDESLRAWRGLLDTGGTVFLDRIDALSPLRQREVSHLLEEQVASADASGRGRRVAVISSASPDLYRATLTGVFSLALYYRLNSILVPVPPLRERREDIEPLLLHFLQLSAERRGVPCPELSEAWQDVLMGHSWPGNVHELRQVAESIVAQPDGGVPSFAPVH